MKKRKIGEVNIDQNTKAEFYLTDITLVYPNKEPKAINYNDIRFIQEMVFEDKEKYIIGLYTRDPTSTKDPSLTFGDFTEAKDFLEAFYSLKNAIPTFENQLVGFYGNVLVQKQKPKKCELGLDLKHVLIRIAEEGQNHFFRIEVNNCKIEDLSAKNIIRISLTQSSLEVLNFSRLEDLFAFKKFMYRAIEESTKEHAVIYDDIEDVDKFKIFLLENSPYLKNLHEKLVVSGAMSENEFWESRTEFQEYKKYYLENKQKLAKNTGLFIKDKITSELEKQRILIQYPEVKGPYLLEVMEGDNFNFEKDKKFWEEFIKLQKKKDTEIVGGKNPVAIPASQTNLYQFGDSGKKVDISEIPLGDVDLCRNLDIKTNVAEKLMHETLKEHYGNYDQSKNDVETTIKKFQVHGLNVLGGIKPIPNVQATSIQEIIDEFRDLIPEHLEIPEEMQVRKVKVDKSGSPQKNKAANDDKMIIEIMSSQKSSQADGKNSRQNAETAASNLKKIMENKTELKERRKNIFNRGDMQHVFKELIQASMQKEETLEFNQYRETYENFNEQAQDLLKLYYSSGIGDDNSNETKKRTMKNLINELIGKINLYLGELDKEAKRQIVQPAPDKTKELSKLNKVMETVLEQLKFAVNVKE